MEVYSSNSFKSKEEQKQKEERERVGKVVKGKKKERNRFLSLFFAEDIDDIRSYLFEDVIIPTIKKGIVDVVTEGINRLLNTNYKASSSTASKYSYKAYYDDKTKGKVLTDTKRDRGYTYDGIIYDTRQDAEEVLNAMTDILDRYQFVTVGDLYDLSDLTPASTAYKYGWSNLREATVERIREGFIINLPKAQPID